MNSRLSIPFHVSYRIFLVMFVLVLSASARSQQITVAVEIVNTPMGQAGSVGVYCTSDIPLAGIRVPLILDDPDIIIDSISYANSIAGPEFEYSTQLSEATGRGFTNIVPTFSGISTFTPDDDELFRIHYRVKDNAIPGLIVIDTFIVRNQVGQLVWYDQMEASDEFGVVTHPDFLWGGIYIQDRVTDVTDGTTALPSTFTVAQNFPNPFNPSTSIPFYLPASSDVEFEVVDILGRSVLNLNSQRYSAGTHVITVDGSQLPSGVYFYRLESLFGSQTRKMTLIK